MRESDRYLETQAAAERESGVRPDRTLRLALSVGLAAAVLIFLVMWAVLPKPAGTMPVGIGENELGVLIERNAESCDLPYGRWSTKIDGACVLEEVLTPGWHEVDLNRFEVKKIDTSVVTITVPG